MTTAPFDQIEENKVTSENASLGWDEKLPGRAPLIHNFVYASVATVAVATSPSMIETAESDPVTIIAHIPKDGQHEEFDADCDRIWTNQQLADLLDAETKLSLEPDVAIDFDPDDYPVY